MSETAHTDYSHDPGYLHGCPGCEAQCHCRVGQALCQWQGHRGQWEWVTRVRLDRPRLAIAADPYGPGSRRYDTTAPGQPWLRGDTLTVLSAKGWTRVKRRVSRGKLVTRPADRYRVGRSPAKGLPLLRADFDQSWDGDEWGRAVGMLHSVAHVLYHATNDLMSERVVPPGGIDFRTWGRVYDVLADYSHGPTVHGWPLRASQGHWDAGWSRALESRWVSVDDLATFGLALMKIRDGLEGLGYGY